ncbi:protein FAM156A/FAM156B-like [Camelus dromedarius]|uniref:protein FAM156A/FAM156B-like n=1 Tax=Camelus dromedarius TaxID=9838 RepID=UPI003119D485
MDPSWRVTPTLKSDSSLTPPKEISQEITSTSQPSFSEAQNMDLNIFNLSLNRNCLTPLPEELLQQQYRDEMIQQERQWERSAFPQRKKTFMENMRQKTLNHTAPYRLGREGKICSSHDKGQNKFKCHCSHIQRDTISEISEEQNSSSWKMLLQGLSNLNLSPDDT